MSLRGAFVALLVLAVILPAAQVGAEDVGARVLLLEISESISSATADYVEAGLQQAAGYAAVIITVNTFGGVGDSMFRIIEAIQESETPVIVYVYPQGGQALSAGTYILMSAGLAAMAPHTLIGSAQPVVNGVPSNETKLINFLVGKMRSMAELHGRNATQAARFVTHNDNLGPEEALRLGVIEVIAEDVGDLLEKADGMTVKTLRGERVLRLAGAGVERLGPDLRVQLLRILSDPLISGILISVGFLALVIGLSSPGFGAEIIGGALIVLGLVGQGFNINWAGLGLVILGSVFVLYEFYSGGVGAAIVGGIILLAVGLILLVRAPPGIIYIATSILDELLFSIIIVASVVAAFLGFVMFKVLRVARRGRYPIAPLAEYGRAAEDIPRGRIGYVVVGGEYRRALAQADIKENQRVRVIGEKEGYLLVEPLEPSVEVG